jgi:hypothetical protein
VNVSYFLVADSAAQKEHKKIVCTIDGALVVASTGQIVGSEKITTATWKNDHTLSNYFLWKYEEPLFSDRIIWSRKWKKFSNSWDNGPWGSSGFSH